MQAAFEAVCWLHRLSIALKKTKRKFPLQWFRRLDIEPIWEHGKLDIAPLTSASLRWEYCLVPEFAIHTSDNAMVEISPIRLVAFGMQPHSRNCQSFLPE
jgi:hypothetical protein